MPTWSGAIAERLATVWPTAATPSAAATLDLAADGLDQPAPWARAAAAKSLDEGRTHYTSRPGVPQLRKLIVERVNARHGVNWTPDDVVITDGGTEAIHVALRILLSETALAPVANRLVTTAPGRPLAPATAAWLATPVTYIAPEAGGLQAYQIAEATKGGGVLLLASPDQPTGLALSASAANAVAEAVTANNLQLALDESLVDALLPNRAAPSPLTSAAVAERTVIVGSFSAAQRLAGWRVGYLATHSAPLKLMRALKQAISICAAAVSQYAAIGALAETPPSWWRDQAYAAEVMYTDVVTRLNNAGFTTRRPDAYPFLWVNVRDRGLTSAVATARAAKRGIAVADGSQFGAAYGAGGEGYIRLTLDPQHPRPYTAIDRLISALLEGS